MVKKTKLIVMAAGLGSRYGGLKQMESVTEQGEIILDFAVYDAMKAGFEDVIFIIKPEMEEAFKDRVLSSMSKYIKTSYVFQEITQVPEGYSVPTDRVKPWGTGHAVMACRDLLDGPFAVINADDYYGRDAFIKIYDFLQNNDSDMTCCMAGYYVENTLSEQGTVTRGICETDGRGNLTAIKETKEIGWSGTEITYPDENGNNVVIPEGTAVSMNFWGFTPAILNKIIEGFTEFLDVEVKTDPLIAEYLLPIEIGKMLEDKEVSVKVLEAADKWYGVTYKEDRDVVIEAFRRMKEEGKYPEKLWP